MKSKLILMALAFILAVSCKRPPKQEMVKVEGKIVDTSGEVVAEGKLEIYTPNAEGVPQLTTVPFKNGQIAGEVPKSNRYVVNVKVRGYGLVSKVFTNELPAYTYELKKATTVTVSPLMGFVAIDANNNCLGSFSKRSDWRASPLASLPILLNGNGEVAGFGMPEELQRAYDFHALAAPCNNGISVTVPAGAIAGSTALPDSIRVSMSAFDLFSPDGMPGEYSAQVPTGTGFMESFGAFNIELYDEKDNSYNLNQKERAQAEVVFPTEVLFPDRKDFPKSVPILYYDEQYGIWKSEQEMAYYDAERKAYVGKVKHFSAINLDLEKDDPACVRILDNDTDGTNPPYIVEVTVPGGGTPRASSRTVNTSDLCVDPGGPVDRNYGLTRLPNNTFASIVFFNAGPVPLATYVVNTGAAHTELVDPARPACSELATLCGTSIVNFNTTPVGSQTILVAGCAKNAANDLRVSVAVNLNVETGGLPAGSQLRIIISDADNCNSTIALPAPVFTHNTAGNFQITQYDIAGSSLCGNGTIQVEVLGSGGGLISNTALVAATCAF